MGTHDEVGLLRLPVLSFPLERWPPIRGQTTYIVIKYLVYILAVSARDAICCITRFSEEVSVQS